jgi:Tol biopolymer transport system component
LDVGRQEVFHAVPQFLPDGRHFIYWAGSKNPENNGTYLASLDSPVVKRIGGDPAMYSPPGYQIFALGSRLVARSFDIQHATLVGDPITITDTFANRSVLFTVSSNGVLAYRTEPTVGTRLIWLDRNGRRQGTLGEARYYTNPAISPDQKKVAVGIEDARTGLRDIWIMDLQRETNFRLTSDPADDFNPTWSPDGSKIAFSSSRKGKGDIYLRAADGGGADERQVHGGPGPFLPERGCETALVRIYIDRDRSQASVRSERCWCARGRRREVADLEFWGHGAVLARRRQGIVLLERQ